MRIIRRFFVSAAAALAVGVFGLFGIEPVIDPRFAIGQKSTLGGRDRSRYMPHQGEREIARRRRQIEAGKLQAFVHPLVRQQREMQAAMERGEIVLTAQNSSPAFVA